MTEQNTPLPPEGLVPPLATPEEFAGKVALVTGGTDGLGEHLCRTLVSFGAEVFFCGDCDCYFAGETCPACEEWGGKGA